MQNKDLEKARKERGERYKKTRLKYDVSISQLSRLSGLARRQIYMIEAGSTSYSIDSLIKYLHGMKTKIQMRWK